MKFASSTKRTLLWQTCNYVYKEQYNEIQKGQKNCSYGYLKVCICGLMQELQSVGGWDGRKVNDKGVNEIISTFAVLWEVLWLTPPDSVKQETKLDPS